jgi:hypothetical protein
MKRFLKDSKKVTRFIQIGILIGLMSLFLVNCSTTDDTEEDVDGEADIFITNDFGESLDVYMDGIYQFIIDHNQTEEIDDVALEEHYLEAKRLGTDEVIATKDIEVASDANYTWTIDDPADINVTNDSGISLKIYIDGEYLFDLVNEENRWIIDVTWGSHLITARKLSDSNEYASTTIEVDENQDYSWTIN